MKFLKEMKQLRSVLHIKTNSVVSDKKNGLTRIFAVADFNLGYRAFFGGFQGIRQQIYENLAQENWISGYSWPWN